MNKIIDKEADDKPLVSQNKDADDNKYDCLKVEGTILYIYYKGELIHKLNLKNMLSDTEELEWAG